LANAYKPSYRSVNPSVSIRRIATELSVGVGTVYKVLEAHSV
jgi:predicted transcriptional regulator